MKHSVIHNPVFFILVVEHNKGDYLKDKCQKRRRLRNRELKMLADLKAI